MIWRSDHDLCSYSYSYFYYHLSFFVCVVLGLKSDFASGGDYGRNYDYVIVIECTIDYVNVTATSNANVIWDVCDL